MNNKQLLAVGSAALLAVGGLGYGIGAATTSASPASEKADNSKAEQPKAKPEQPKADTVASDPSFIKISVDPLDDSKSYIMAILSDNEQNNSIGIAETASLAIRCDSSGKDVFINPPEYMSSGDSHRIRLRWDDGVTTSEWWHPASGGGAAFSQAPMSTLAKMTQHDKLVIGYKPYNKTESAAIFDLKKVRPDLVKMQAYCK